MKRIIQRNFQYYHIKSHSQFLSGCRLTIHDSWSLNCRIPSLIVLGTDSATSLQQDHIDHIRRTYTKNFNSTDAATRQVAVATYLIDRLALRAGNEKVSVIFRYAE